MSLIETARANTPSNHKNITPEHVELALAFVNGEVGISAINAALGHSKTSIQGYITICRALRHQKQTSNT